MKMGTLTHIQTK